MTTLLQPLPGFNWMLVNWSGPDEVMPDDCSYCGYPIGEDEMPLRMWNKEYWSAQFCTHCMEVWFGFRCFSEDCDHFSKGEPP